MFYWLMKYVFIGPLFKVFFRPEVEGAENLPSGPVLLCPNHLSFIDSFLVPLMIRRKVVFLGKSDYFDKWWMSWFFKAAGVIPVRREGGGAGDAALHAGVEQLEKGLAVGIYPEGTRSPDGRLYRGKTGPARMALRARCPIVPVAVSGTDKALPSGKYLPRPLRLKLRYGKPLDFSRYHGKEDDRFVLRSMTDELMYELMLLTGQEYVDEYASKFKGNIPTDAAPAAEQPGEQRAAS